MKNDKLQNKLGYSVGLFSLKKGNDISLAIDCTKYKTESLLKNFYD